MNLGVNIDHVATLRQARRTSYPDLLLAARAAEVGGAHSITIHLREDRRHIQDHDVYALRRSLRVPLNLEMAALDEMADIASAVRPWACCIVPERRAELTTEGGLDVVREFERLAPLCRRLTAADIEVALFVEADSQQIDAARRLGAQAIELHTGRYAEQAAAAEFARLQMAVEHARSAGLVVNAGHGLNYDNVSAIAALRGIRDLNIGHAIVARSVFTGLTVAVADMRRLIDEAAA
jgi:pyridoxine 5-phosphate synthase